MVGIIGMSSQPDSSTGPRGVWFVPGGLFENPPEGVPNPVRPGGEFTRVAI